GTDQRCHERLLRTRWRCVDDHNPMKSQFSKRDRITARVLVWTIYVSSIWAGMPATAVAARAGSRAESTAAASTGTAGGSAVPLPQVAEAEPVVWRNVA